MAGSPQSADNSQSTVDPRDRTALLTIQEAAERLNISRSTAYGLISAGSLEVVHIGRAARVPVDAINDFVRQLREQQARGAINGHR